MIRGGQQEAVREYRLRFQAVIAPELIRRVEDVLERKASTTTAKFSSTPTDWSRSSCSTLQPNHQSKKPPDSVPLPARKHTVASNRGFYPRTGRARTLTYARRHGLTAHSGQRCRSGQLLRLKPAALNTIKASDSTRGPLTLRALSTDIGSLKGWLVFVGPSSAFTPPRAQSWTTPFVRRASAAGRAPCHGSECRACRR
jgi:hypothetical protein